MTAQRKVLDAQQLLDGAVTEAELQEAVIELAQLRGWLVHHCRPSRRIDKDDKERWATPIQGDTGFPDLVLVRSDPIPELLFVELKRQEGSTTKGQTRWLRKLERVAVAACDLTVEVAIWRPSHWSSGEIEERLA